MGCKGPVSDNPQWSGPTTAPSAWWPRWKQILVTLVRYGMGYHMVKVVELATNKSPAYPGVCRALPRSPYAPQSVQFNPERDEPDPTTHRTIYIPFPRFPCSTVCDCPIWNGLGWTVRPETLCKLLTAT